MGLQASGGALGIKRRAGSLTPRRSQPHMSFAALDRPPTALERRLAVRNRQRFRPIPAPRHIPWRRTGRLTLRDKRGEGVSIILEYCHFGVLPASRRQRARVSAVRQRRAAADDLRLHRRPPTSGQRSATSAEAPSRLMRRRAPAGRRRTGRQDASCLRSCGLGHAPRGARVFASSDQYACSWVRALRAAACSGLRSSRPLSTSLALA